MTPKNIICFRKKEGRDVRNKKGDVTTDSMGVKNILNNSRLFENLEF